MTKVFNADYVCLKQTEPILVVYDETTKTMYWNFLEYSERYLFVKKNILNEDYILKNLKESIFKMFLSIDVDKDPFYNNFKKYFTLQNENI